MIRGGPPREREDKTGDPSAHPIYEPPSGRHRGESGALSNEGMRRRVRNIGGQLQENDSMIRGSQEVIGWMREDSVEALQSLSPSSLMELSQVHTPALLSSLVFALHPVHTEAVAGIVGHAELLCAALSIPGEGLDPRP